MGRNPSCTPQMRQLIVNMYCVKNMSMAKIAGAIGVGKTMVQNAIKLYCETGSTENKQRRFPPRKTTDHEDRAMVRMCKRDPFLTSVDILDRMMPRLQLPISNRTVQRRLVEKGLHGCIARRKPHVSQKNIEKRLIFARSHLQKPISFWKNVLWSDESKFNLFGSDGKRYVRRPTNMALDPHYTIKTIKHGGGNVMVWGSFSWHGVGPLVQIMGRMDQFQYKAIMENDMLPYAEENMPLRWTYQHDNDPKHTARSVKSFLLASKVTVMEWPAQSPDLNPIENLWSYVDHRLKGLSCKNSTELFNKLQELWMNIPTDYCKSLVESLPRRCHAVLANRGYPTKY